MGYAESKFSNGNLKLLESFVLITVIQFETAKASKKLWHNLTVIQLSKDDAKEVDYSNKEHSWGKVMQ